MKTLYTIDRAAHLLGVEPARLQDLIAQNLVDTVKENGEVRVPKREVARLYHWMAEDQDEPPAAAEAAEPVPTAAEPVPEDWVEVDDEELLRLHGEMKQYGERIQNLAGKIHRLGMRISRIKAMANGDNARFWERAGHLYPQLHGQLALGLEERDGRVFLAPQRNAEADDFRKRFQALLDEGIQKRHLPPGFLGYHADEGKNE